MSDFWDFIQHAQIDSARSKAIDAKFNAEIANNKVDQLENRVEALALACQAMWELLAPKIDGSTQILAEKMEEIDLRDGKRDGKSTLDVSECLSCHHKLSGKHPYCFYCGAKLPLGKPFHSRAT